MRTLEIDVPLKLFLNARQFYIKNFLPKFLTLSSRSKSKSKRIRLNINCCSTYLHIPFRSNLIVSNIVWIVSIPLQSVTFRACHFFVHFLADYRLYSRKYWHDAIDIRLYSIFQMGETHYVMSWIISALIQLMLKSIFHFEILNTWNVHRRKRNWNALRYVCHSGSIFIPPSQI